MEEHIIGACHGPSVAKSSLDIAFKLLLKLKQGEENLKNRLLSCIMLWLIYSAFKYLLYSQAIIVFYVHVLRSINLKTFTRTVCS